MRMPSRSQRQGELVCDHITWTTFLHKVYEYSPLASSGRPPERAEIMTGEIPPQARALATSPEDLSWIPKTHMVKERIDSFKSILDL